MKSDLIGLINYGVRDLGSIQRMTEKVGGQSVHFTHCVQPVGPKIQIGPDAESGLVKFQLLNCGSQIGSRII